MPAPAPHMPAPAPRPDAPPLVRLLTALDAALTHVAAVLAPQDEDAMAARTFVK